MLGLAIVVPTIIVLGTNDSIQVSFSPKGGCTDAIVKCINQANKSIYVQAYSFTSLPIINALIQASERKVSVSVILDSDDAATVSKIALTKFTDPGKIPVWIDKKHAIAHNKVMIIDESIVITGSFNFTNQAETSNAENLLIIKNKDLATAYLKNWNLHQSHSVK